MRNKNLDWEDQYDYSPNQLADLSINNPREYRAVVESNLEPGDTVEKWEQRNLEWAQQHINQQKFRNPDLW